MNLKNKQTRSKALEEPHYKFEPLQNLKHSKSQLNLHHPKNCPYLMTKLKIILQSPSKQSHLFSSYRGTLLQKANVICNVYHQLHFLQKQPTLCNQVKPYLLQAECHT